MKETHSKFKPTCVQVFGKEEVEQQRCSSVIHTHSSPSMAVHKGTFETLIPSQFISFTFPNPHSSKHTLNFNGDLLRIAVLDSPIQTSDPPLIAAMLVPKNREDDWIFSTKTGHLQLLMNSPGISRLILIGNLPRDDDDDDHGDVAHVLYNRPILDDTKYRMEFQESLAPLLIALSPKSYFINGDLSEIPFVTYEDNVIRSLVVEKCVGSCVGEMLVEDIEIENFDEMEKKSPKREFRRRLRFKRMPNLVQTEISIVPDTVNTSIGEGGFRSETDSLVHPYLPPMLASLSLIAPYLEECNQPGNLKPRVLCVGIGGGALLTFLRTHFEFEVFGVESDEMVVKVARQYFGLVEDEFLRVFVGDGIEVIRNFARGSILGDMSSSAGTGNVVTDQCMNVFDNHYSPFDIIMVDLDSSDAISGLGAPPLEFVQRSMLLAVKTALHKFGIIVINVIPLNRSFYDSLISEFREVFSELYEINVGNGENYVLVATVSPIRFVPNVVENSIIKKLKLTTSRQYMDSIRKI